MYEYPKLLTEKHWQVVKKLLINRVPNDTGVMEMLRQLRFQHDSLMTKYQEHEFLKNEKRMIYLAEQGIFIRRDAGHLVSLTNKTSRYLSEISLRHSLIGTFTRYCQSAVTELQKYKEYLNGEFLNWSRQKTIEWKKSEEKERLQYLKNAIPKCRAFATSIEVLATDCTLEALMKAAQHSIDYGATVTFVTTSQNSCFSALLQNVFEVDEETIQKKFRKPFDEYIIYQDRAYWSEAIRAMKMAVKLQETPSDEMIISYFFSGPLSKKKPLVEHFIRHTKSLIEQLEN